MAVVGRVLDLFFPHRAQMPPELDVHPPIPSSLSSHYLLSLYPPPLTPPSPPFFQACHCSTIGSHDHHPVGKGFLWGGTWWSVGAGGHRSLVGRGMADFISLICYLRACLCRTVVRVWDDEVTQGVIQEQKREGL